MRRIIRVSLRVVRVVDSLRLLAVTAEVEMVVDRLMKICHKNMGML